MEDSNVVLRWRPNVEPFFYSYEVYLVHNDALELLSPMPLRAAIWIDTAPDPGVRVYAVRSVSASGIASKLVISPTVSTR